MRVSRIELRNFQNHRWTDIDLHPGLNAFIGPSDSGKSAIIRALRWAVTGRPGTHYRSKAGGDTSVAIILEDGTRVERIKRDSSSEYIIVSPEGEETRFKSSAVPQEVTSILGLDPNLHFQGQHDNPFLLSASSGEVARALNRAAGLETIDAAIKTGNATIQKVRGDLQRVRDSLKEKKQALERYRDLPNARRLFDEAVEIEQRIKQERAAAENLDKTLTELAKVEKELAGLSWVDEVSQEVQELEDELLALQKLELKVASLESLLDRITKARNKEKLEKAISYQKNLDQVEQEMERLRKLRHEVERLETLLDMLTNVENEACEVEETIFSLTDRLKNFVCPTCGRPWDQVEIESWRKEGRGNGAQ